MAISTNPKPTIYLNLYENTGPGSCVSPWQTCQGFLLDQVTPAPLRPVKLARSSRAIHFTLIKFHPFNVISLAVINYRVNLTNSPNNFNFDVQKVFSRLKIENVPEIPTACQIKIADN